MIHTIPCIFKPNVPTLNGHVYEIDALRLALDAFMEDRDRFVTSDNVGMAVSLERIVGKVVGYDLTQDDLFFEVKFLRTPMGELYEEVHRKSSRPMVCSPAMIGDLDGNIVRDLKILYLNLTYPDS